MADEHALMELGSAGQQGHHIRNSEAAADVARQIDDPRGVIEFLFGDKVERHNVDRHKEKCHSCRLIDSRHHRGAKIDVQVERSHVKQGNGHDHDTDNHQPTRIEMCQQLAHKGQHDDHYDSSRRKHQPAQHRRISQQGLKKNGKQGGAPIHDKPQHKHR